MSLKLLRRKIIVLEYFKLSCKPLMEVGNAAHSLRLNPLFPRHTSISSAHFLPAEPSRWMFEDLSLLQGLYLLESLKEVCWALSNI